MWSCRVQLCDEQGRDDDAAQHSFPLLQDEEQDAHKIETVG